MHFVLNSLSGLLSGLHYVPSVYIKLRILGPYKYVFISRPIRAAFGVTSDKKSAIMARVLSGSLESTVVHRFWSTGLRTALLVLHVATSFIRVNMLNGLHFVNLFLNGLISRYGKEGDYHQHTWLTCSNGLHRITSKEIRLLLIAGPISSQAWLRWNKAS